MKFAFSSSSLHAVGSIANSFLLFNTFEFFGKKIFRLLNPKLAIPASSFQLIINLAFEQNKTSEREKKETEKSDNKSNEIYFV